MRGTGGGSGRWLAGALACCVTALLGVVGTIGVPAVASAGTGTSSLASAPSSGSAPSLATAGGRGASAPLGSALVIAGSPTQGEQVQAGAAARWASPQARVAREKSRTAFERLNAGTAAKLARAAFPGVVDDRAGGPPQLPAGQKIVGYPTDKVAQVELGGGKHAVIESMQPLALEGTNGHREPVDLSLQTAGSAFQPTRSGVGLHIPKRLADGVQLIGTGVSLTPVDASGAPLGGSEGTVDGASVLYANTQVDTDSLVKPTTDGFDADTLLRSVESPQQLFFRVGLPAGASLVRAKDGSGAVRVMDAGTAIAAILPPSAQDAAGTPVPLSMSVLGNTVTLTVDHRSAEYQYPIEVDPEFNLGSDSTLSKSTWEFTSPTGGYTGSSCCGEVLIYGEPTNPPAGDYGELVYRTNGDSRIYSVNTHVGIQDIYGGQPFYLSGKA